MRFALKVVSTNNERRVKDIVVEATDEQTARMLAQEQGYRILGISASRSTGIRFLKPVFPVVTFSIQLIALLEAGLNLVEAVQALNSQEHATAETRQVLITLHDSLQRGKSFSQALEGMPSSFPAVYCAVVQASERTGNVRQALQKYVEYADAFGQVKRKLATAMVYPAVLVTVATLVILFLLLHVIPRFAHLYDDRRGARPFFSTLLQSLGATMEANGHWIVLGLITVAITAALSLRQPAVRAEIDRRLWRIPFVGTKMKLFQLARLYRTLGMLLRAGTPILPSLDMAVGVLTEQLRLKLQNARAKIEAGQSLSLAFGSVGLTTSVSTQMMIVGERAGNMGEMLERAAAFCDEEFVVWLDNAMRLFEPLLMVVLGISVGAVVVLMYMPIFELASSIQ